MSDRTETPNEPAAGDGPISESDIDRAGSQEVEPRLLTEGQRPVSWRALGIGCALIPAMALWTVRSEFSGHPHLGAFTTLSLFPLVMTVVLLISLVNLYLQRRAAHYALSSAEILTIFVMLSVGSVLCSHDFLQIMIPMISYIGHAANPQNRWGEIILPHVPDWAIVTDADATAALVAGNEWLYRKEILAAWAVPLFMWGVFIIALMTVLLCINLFFRAAWTERERLAFPVIQIPLIIATELQTMLRKRLFWLGFGIAASICLINGLAELFPAVPKIPTQNIFNLREYFIERPWSAIAETKISIYPFVIGLVYFIPTELAFSCWFFYLVYRAMLLLSAAIGVRDLPGFPFIDHQAAGGYLAVGCLAVWLSRRHLSGVVRTILGRPGGLDESREAMSYRTTALVMLCALAVLLAFGMGFGASFGVIVTFLVIFFMYSLAIARMRAELGTPSHDLHYTGPEMLLTNAVGTKEMGADNLTAFSLMGWFNRAYRSHFSAHSVEGLKIAQVTRSTSRSMMWAMMTAVFVGLLSAYWAILHLLYRYGMSGQTAAIFYGQESWRRLEGWLTFPRDANIAATVATGIGFLFTLFLGAMQTRFAWWLWHPIGYATASSGTMEGLWVSIFITWLAKSLIARYGGAAATRTALWLFVGLVLGDFVMGTTWNVIGLSMGKTIYRIW